MKKLLLPIKRFCVLLYGDMHDYFCALYDELRLHCAIKLADAKQRAYNKRYFVMPDYLNKLTVLNNDDIKWLKRARLMKKNVSHLEIMRDCFYYTPLSRNDEGSRMTVEERLKRKAKWLSYMENVRTELARRKYARLKSKRHGKK